MKKAANWLVAVLLIAAPPIWLIFLAVLQSWVRGPDANGPLSVGRMLGIYLLLGLIGFGVVAILSIFTQLLPKQLSITALAISILADMILFWLIIMGYASPVLHGQTAYAVLYLTQLFPIIIGITLFFLARVVASRETKS
ncbi:hypothetical protein LH991_02275 [Schleiferilactobacillus harbinensis]|nr:hypothetical protein [Schleiferilactobacillus harbinensis]QFR62894.1 hypothetical protein LH991_02275 [Schleiferilactobacillus harbinensis]